MSVWRGNISDLGSLAANLADLSAVPSQASRDAARGIKRAIDEEFRSGQDPYGEPWEPLAESTIAKKGGDARILIETGEMQRGIEVKPTAGAGIAITSRVGYLGFHQGEGAPNANVPPRHVLPEGDMPDAWGDAISNALDRAFDRQFR